MKLFKFNNEVKGSSGKCGYCNWERSEVYVIADTQKEAKGLLTEWRKDEGNGFCGDCVCDILMEDGYTLQSFRKLDVLLKKKEVEKILKGETIVWADDVEDVHIKME